MVVPLLIIDLFTTKKYVKISLSEMALDKEVIKDMGRFAVPASVGQAVSSSLGFVIIQSIILSYGDHVSAGFSVGNRISSLLLNPCCHIFDYGCLYWIKYRTSSTRTSEERVIKYQEIYHYGLW